MIAQTDWTQHILIKSLCDKDLKKVNNKIFSELSVELFTSETYAYAFRRIDAVYQKQGRFLTWKELVNDPTLSDEVRRRLRSKEVKRKSILPNDPSVARPKNFAEYKSLCANLLNNARHISLINLHNELSDKLQSSMTEDEVNNLLDYTQEKLSKIESLSTSKGSLFEVTVDSVHERFRKFYKDLQNKLFLPTGYKAFDDENRGIPRDSLWMIAGKTGTGKSSLCLDVLMNMKKNGARVCLLPLEMSIEQMLIRMGAHLIGVPANEIVANFKQMGRKVLKALKEFLNESDDNPSCFHFYEPDVDETLDTSLKVLSTQHYDIIAVDYINLMAPMGGEEGWQSLNIAGRYAKRFASNNKTCILFLVQLDDTTNEIRYSRALKEHASNFWKWDENLHEIMENGYITIKQQKARNQNPISFRLRVDLKTCRYEDYIEVENYSSQKGVKPVTKEFERNNSTIDIPSNKDI